MNRPVIEWMDDNEDYSEGYLALIDDCTAMLQAIIEFQVEILRKQAIWEGEREDRK